MNRLSRVMNIVTLLMTEFLLKQSPNQIAELAELDDMKLYVLNQNWNQSDLYQSISIGFVPEEGGRDHVIPTIH